MKEALVVVPVVFRAQLVAFDRDRQRVEVDRQVLHPTAAQLSANPFGDSSRTDLLNPTRYCDSFSPMMRLSFVLWVLFETIS